MKEQFKDIIREHHAMLYKIGRSYTSEEADFKDLYQEMLIQLWKSMKRFKGKAKLSTWVYRVVLNTALTYKRNKKRRAFTIGRVQTIPSTELESLPLPEDSSSTEDRVELLYRCINQLKKDERAIILLYLENHKYEEIAEITGLSTNHIGVKILRIKNQLAKLLSA